MRDANAVEWSDIDVYAGSEQSQDSLPGFLRAAVKHTSVLLYGEDTREHMSLPGREEYTRDATAIALLAFKTDRCVSTKRESVQTYRELINDEWVSFLEAMFERGKLRWSYNLPEQIEERGSTADVM